MTAVASPDARVPFPYVGMAALGVGSFSIITVEILPTGVLPLIARSLGETEALVGTLVSVFAFAVVFFSVPLTQLTRRMPRKTLVLVALAVATAAGILAGAAPNFLVLAAIRAVGGAAHGLFWSVVGAYPSYLVEPGLVGRAVAINSAGSSLAGVAGLPIGTWIGQTLTWRWSFVIVSLIGVVALFLVARFLPPVQGAHERGRDAHPAPTRTADPRADTAAGDDVVSVPVATSSVPIITGAVHVQSSQPGPDEGGVRAVAIICITTAIFMTGSFAFSTYVAPLMRDVVGLPESTLSAILFGQGVVGLISVLLTGWLLTARPRRWLLVCMVAQVILALGLWLAAPASVWAALAIFWTIALVGGAIPMLLQVLMLHIAPERIRDVSLSFYTLSFNTGIGSGALVGAAVVQGWGVHQVVLVNMALAVVALTLYVVGYTLPRSRARR